MTVSPDARTPSATVHPLSGSTPPGAGAVMQPFGIATTPAANAGDTFVPLGGAALDAVANCDLRRGAPVQLHPADARLIELADALEDVERRANAFNAARAGRKSNDVEDDAFGEITDEFRPIEDEIAVTPAATMAGVIAKARAFQVPTTRHCAEEGLYLSLADDLVRLSAAVPAQAAARAADPFAGYHDEILGLEAVIAATDERSPESEAAWARWKELDGIILASRPTTVAGAVGALGIAQGEHYRASIECRPEEELGTDDRLIHHLFTSALPLLRPLVRPNTLPLATTTEPAAAHELIVAALDRAADLRDKIDAGLPDEEADACTAERMNLVQRAAEAPMTTMAAAIAALEWVRGEFASAHVEVPSPEPTDVLMLGFLDRALGVLRPEEFARALASAA